MRLDHNATTFQTFHMAWRAETARSENEVAGGEDIELAASSPMGGKAVRNVLFNTWPAVYHFNGGSKHLQTAVEAESPAALAWAALPDAARRKFLLEPLTAPGATGGALTSAGRLTVGDVCCGEWAVRGGGNRARSPWLPC